MGVTLDVRVAELLCSRLCHDLVSPIGAINNGIELIEDDGGMADQAMALIAQSGRRAADRLRCFRLAYGSAGGQSTIGIEEGREVAAAWLAGGKVTLDWPAPPRVGLGLLPPGTVKLLLNLVILAEEMLVHGGRIAVALTPPAQPKAATVTADGRGAVLGAAAAAALAGTVAPQDLTARTVHAYATGLFARAYGMTVGSAPNADRRLVLQLVLPT